MVQVDILVTDSELKSLSNYAVKSIGGLSAAGFQVIAEGVIPVSKNAVVSGYRCHLSLPFQSDEAELLIKVSGGHTSLSGTPSKEQLLGRSKYILRNKLGDQPIDISQLPREQRLLMDRLQSIVTERTLLESSNVMISTSEFITKCYKLLHRHFLIDGSVDSINATSDAVFNNCLGVQPKSYKAQHWISYIKDSTHDEPLKSIVEKIMNTTLINPTLNIDVPKILNQKYIDRNNAGRIAAVIDSSLLSTSVRIREDFSNQVLDLEPRPEQQTFKGIIFGLSQNVTNGKPRFALRVKSDNGQLLELESASEYFGGLLPKAQVLEAIKNETPISFQGTITSVNNGIRIADRVLFPAITSISAKKIEFGSVHIIERTQNLTKRKFV